ncbi:MAG: hypothetical protein CMP67_06875 [Flavobacteriales bacterium]|nr:hypothetical protein [Flavobacteriales bacterium]MBO73463.1 hypothetical protein [Flavobacteriales bacterium]|tara:strand:+ start:140 stop:919 length:780 start_codon:yes stop_codon:yes gene_type:complete
MSASQKIGIAFRSYGSAHRFIKKHKLWHYVYIPGILNIVLFYFSFNWFINSVAGWVTGIFDLDCEGGLFVWFCYMITAIAGYLEFFVKAFLYVAFIGLYLNIYKSILLILYSPILAFLIDTVEKKDKGVNEPFRMEQLLKDTVRGIVIALRSLFMEGVAVFALFVMAFVPIINIVQPILLWIVSAYFLGVSMLDYTLEKKGMNAKGSINYMKKHKALTTGIGSVFQLVFLIPFLGWMIAPTYSAVAAYFAVEELEKIGD